ncbi:MAG TPA: glycine cleavage system aminomethyltransferase GcvT [bacterium]|nr:glycine cleavage system aminomethyltransferase GcvT [bacterium]
MDIRKTLLFEEHTALNALMAPFAGWNMPIHYGSIIEETKHTRTAVSVFDICHMGEIIIKESPEKSSFGRAVTVPVGEMKIGSCRYGFLLNEEGGILDDLLIYRKTEDEWMAVVNAGTADQDFEIIKKRAAGAEVSDISGDTAKFDIQGPGARDVMKKIAGPDIEKLGFYKFGIFDIDGEKHIISRTGYTGELGYEIYIPNGKAAALWREILKSEAVKPAGLGARDILRLEAGLPLYGNELTPEITPFEAGFERFINFERDFFGRDALVKKREEKGGKKLFGFEVDSRRTPRHGNKITVNGEEKGIVTSGAFSPHLNKGIGFGYFEKFEDGEKAEFDIDTGRGMIKAKIVKTPFLNETSLKK